MTLKSSRPKRLPKARSGIIPAAQMRRGGPMRDKRSKRAEENKNPDYQESAEEMIEEEQLTAEKSSE